MLKVLFSIFFWGVFGCRNNQTNKIKINSEYFGKLDSLIVVINFKPVTKILNLNHGLDTTIYYSPKKFLTGHDSYLYVNLYNDGKLLDSFFTFNDLNYIPPSIKIILTDSIKMKVSFQ